MSLQTRHDESSKEDITVADEKFLISSHYLIRNGRENHTGCTGYKGNCHYDKGTST